MPIKAGNTTVNDTNHAVGRCRDVTSVPILVSTFESTMNTAPFKSPAVNPPDT